MTSSEILKIIPTKKWATATTPGHLLPCYGWMFGAMRMKKYFKHYPSAQFLIIRPGGLASQFFAEREIYDCAKQLYKNYHTAKRVIAQWQKAKNKFFRKWALLNNGEKLKSLSDKEISEIVKNFFDDQVEIWAAPMAADMLGLYSETTLLAEFTKALPAKERPLAHEYFAAISQPEKLSFLQRERLSFLTLALLGKNKAKELAGALKKHQSEFFWIKNTYRYLQVLPISYFRRFLLKETKKSKKEIKAEVNHLKRLAGVARRNRSEFFKKFFMPSSLKAELVMTPILGAWHDERKEYNLKSDHLLLVLAKEIAFRLKRDIVEIYSLLPAEISSLLRGRKSVKSKEMRGRLKYLVLATVQPEQGFLWGGQAAKRIIKKFDDFLNIKKKENVVVKGMVACQGEHKFYQGRVKIIHDVKKDDFKAGEVLVTSSTRPEFVIFMRQALAIVTDEGGIASHAAIVSRELNKPCIIGTKIATKVFRDGDLVEVDAERGAVKIIKQIA